MATKSPPETLDSVIQYLQQAGINVESIEEPVWAAISEGNIAPLLAWARERGAIRARLGEAMKAAIEEALSLGRAVANVTLDGLTGDKLSAALVDATVDGYIEASDSTAIRSYGRAPLEQLQDRVEELTALHRVISAANSSLKLSDMLLETAQAVVAVTHADICSIFIYEPERDQLVLTASSDPNVNSSGPIRLQLGEGITGWAAMAGVPLAVRNARSDPRFKHVPGAYESRAASILAVPVVLFTNEKLVGVIAIQTIEERDFSGNEIKFLETVAGEIAIAIENARLYEQTDARLRQKVAELTTLQGVSAHIAATLNLSEVLSLIAHQAAHLVHADAAAIYALNPDSNSLEQVAQYDLENPQHNIYQGKIGPHVTLDVEQSVIARAVLRGIPVHLPPDADANLGLETATQGYNSMFCVPLVAPRGIMGGICLYDRDERTFTEEEIHLLDAFGHEAAIALENSRLYDAALRGLQIKSAMLQEMNHRVRNNLQTVAGLLSMQMRRMSPDSKAAIAVRESIARIQSMAAVHDLMISRDITYTSVYDLSRKVAEATASTLRTPGFDLQLLIDPKKAQDIKIDSHEATLLALLLNELVSNAILHGFAGLKSGEIRIRAWRGGLQTGGKGRALARSSRCMINIEVKDNGIGLPADFDPERSANLGLSIVRTMVLNDLRGVFEIKHREDSRGTVARISFRHSEQSGAQT